MTGSHQPITITLLVDGKALEMSTGILPDVLEMTSIFRETGVLKEQQNNLTTSPLEVVSLVTETIVHVDPEENRIPMTEEAVPVTPTETMECSSVPIQECANTPYSRDLICMGTKSVVQIDTRENNAPMAVEVVSHLPTQAREYFSAQVEEMTDGNLDNEVCCNSELVGCGNSQIDRCHNLQVEECCHNMQTDECPNEELDVCHKIEVGEGCTFKSIECCTLECAVPFTLQE